MTKNTCLPISVKSKPIVLIAAGLFLVGLAQAQESVNASGGNVTGSGGVVSYSVGQVVYTSNTGSTGTVEQGVLHAYEIFTVDINETALNISISAFPNPTNEDLTLQISDYNNENLSYQLFDMHGKQLSNGQIVAQQTQINMTNLPSATYFVNVINKENLPADRQGKKIQSFKIVKL